MIAAVLATGLLATACGGSDDSSDDPLPGADTGSSASPDPTEGEGEGDEADDETGEDELPEDGIDRPEINLPDDVNNVFEEVDTDDPVELAVLADQEHAINAVDEAITSGDTKVPSLPFYQADMALLESVEVISSMHDDKLSFGGITRYYNRSLEMQSETAAVSSYCRDTSESYLIDLETGEKEPDGGTTHFTSRQQVNDAGVWQTVTLEARDGEGRCER
ncbi:hypothetical protein [Streptomyces lonarensis]|uniref:Uncharacterized protein n=1 Tax=Streptomyces lonarensis TaxID=700599 RepID=A0A7X6D4Y1_9ACTN|nr:hypothetical protein [Streptomyces lonarensis]NJQ08269.1 hypothetical protein [Streptomyces lonarensis]